MAQRRCGYFAALMPRSSSGASQTSLVHRYPTSGAATARRGAGMLVDEMLGPQAAHRDRVLQFTAGELVFQAGDLPGNAHVDDRIAVAGGMTSAWGRIPHVLPSIYF